MDDAKKRTMRDRLVSRAGAASRADATGTTDSGAEPSPATPLSTPPAPVTSPTPAPTTSPLRLEPREVSPVKRDSVAPNRRRNPAWQVLPWMAAAASIGVALAQLRTNGELTGERDAARAALTAATASTTQLSAQLASRDSLVAAMTGAQVSVVELASTAKLAPGARMFWDHLTNRWTLITHDLQPVQAGRTYQLWLVTAKAEKISAGTFNTDAQGRAVVQATYALAEADLAAIAITEEPEGGSPQPTGTILVAGAPAAPR
jgi:anti-sigma-K factor RskA